MTRDLHTKTWIRIAGYTGGKPHNPPLGLTQSVDEVSQAIIDADETRNGWVALHDVHGLAIHVHRDRIITYTAAS